MKRQVSMQSMAGERCLFPLALAMGAVWPRDQYRPDRDEPL